MPALETAINLIASILGQAADNAPLIINGIVITVLSELLLDVLRPRR